jgi:glutamyl-tRNA synthetase
LNWLALAGWGQQAEVAESGTTKAAPDSTTLMTLSDMIREVKTSVGHYLV